MAIVESLVTPHSSPPTPHHHSFELKRQVVLVGFRVEVRVRVEFRIRVQVRVGVPVRVEFRVRVLVRG